AFAETGFAGRVARLSALRAEVGIPAGICAGVLAGAFLREVGLRSRTVAVLFVPRAGGGTNALTAPGAAQFGDAVAGALRTTVYTKARLATSGYRCRTHRISFRSKLPQITEKRKGL